MSNDKSRKIKKVIFFNLCLLAILAGLWQFIPDSVRILNESSQLDAGENWIFALTKYFSNSWFPFYPVVMAVIQYHTPAWLQVGAGKFVFLLPVILAFSAGSLIHSFSAGIISAALSAVLGALLFSGGIQGFREEPYDHYIEQALIAAAMLMLVCGLSIKFRSYILKSFFIGLLLAVALHTKGVIALFIPVVFVYETYREQGRARFLRQWPAMTVLLTVVSAWVIVNWVGRNGFVLFEGQRANCVIVQSALGLVASTGYLGDDWQLALSGIHPGQSVFLWAAREILAHPLRYIAAIGYRLHCILFKQPLAPGLPVLFFLWLCGVYRLRRLAAALPLLLLTLYLLLIHLLMLLDVRYLVPMWFLVCTLTGIFFADMLGGTPKQGGYEHTNAKAVFYAASTPVIILWAVSFMLLISYPLRSKAAHDLGKLGQLETEYPGVPWIHEMAAREALRTGDWDRAVDSRRKAYEVDNCLYRKHYYLKTAFMTGRISGAQLQEHFRNDWEHEPLMLAALRYGEEGKLAKAGKILPCALQLCVRNSTDMHFADSKNVVLLKKMQRDSAKNCLSVLSEMISTLDTKRRGLLRDRLAQIYPGLWRPELLFSAFEAGSAEGYPEIQVCQIQACLGVVPLVNPESGSPSPITCKGCTGCHTLLSGSYR
ncbi:MAG: hypothetical protein A2X34_05580 [Elusimicrobia bacterium GWC2_51_8]|nr:MAG: hypothetical protein A2X33_01630 [Elusimicrobia bacterium GWA2_51_34]OGR62519.1 MAG: hypothetical protein A2X34_05580 [Elusimicrobia bacterium GWC2_51_8]OGR85299.1 MAG: hypothetical protein A2021_01365 [Elusimicrobia bacterium GWF2_52_66]HCE97839.1 hypothetical protein [Elusimicrobiota bacterium]